MAELKFNVARMKEVNSRLEEISEQLTTSANENSDEISNITSNITGDEVVNVLKSYKETSDYVIKNTKTQIAQLKDYLQQQIIAYSTTEQSASDSLTDIQNMLNQIEG